MAKIPLRAYIKEIENQIERGEIEQAIGHAKNILKSYPKNIDTYRLLGKAFLESQRYSEAADILQRVLSVLPDDFVSQIGMSIIREDEGNLDAAIWHMERAYEVQPFNPAVQEELRRLYGRRDGIEPPKIRLTRGALVRMYSRGELYSQAIAETRAALAEDPQRLDLLVLLARLYYLSDHKNDAAEVCSELLRKLPYCYEANQLLAQFLPSTNRAEEAQKFLQRIYALDPYAAFISPTAPTSEQVPDQAVMVEQFTWESAMEDAQTPEWARNVGVAWEESTEEVLPDWLNTLKPEAPSTRSVAPAQPVEEETSMQESTPSAETEDLEASKDELIPDWMKDAGWIPSDRKADDIMAEQAAAQGEESDEILPAELPDWVQSIAPHETGNTPETDERTDWLNTILSQPESENESGIVPPPQPEKDESQDGLPDWVTNAGTGTQMPSSTELSVGDLPDWFSQMEGETPPGETTPTEDLKPADFEGLPDWSQLGEPAITEPSPGTDKTPDWLRSFDVSNPEPPAATEQTPDWLGSLETETPVQPEDNGGVTDWLTSVQPEAVEPAADIPDWLQTLSGEEEGSQLPEAEKPLDEALVSAASDILADIEVPEVIEAPVQESLEEVQPESVLDASLPQETTIVEETPAAAVSPEPTAEGMPDFSDMDSAMAWLESLAAKQGADEATLVTPPEQRLDQPPDWVAKEMENTEASAFQPEIEMPAPTEEIPVLEETFAAPVESAGELPDWLQSIESESEQTGLAVEPPAVDEMPTLSEESEPELPDWMQAEVTAPEETVETAPASQAAVQPETAMPDLSDMDAAMAWLESLAAKQGADEATLVTPPEQRLEQPPDWVTHEMEIPEQAEPATGVEATAEVEAEAAVEAEIEQPAMIEEPALPEAAAEPVIDWLEQEETIIPADTIESAPAAEEMPAQPQAAEAAIPDFSDMDAAMAWLESLAAKQGADEATLVTPPEQRLEQPPDWVTNEMEAQASVEPVGAEYPAVEDAHVEESTVYDAAVVDATAFDTAAFDAAASTVESEGLLAAEEAVLPDWLQDAIKEETPIADEAAAVAEHEALAAPVSEPIVPAELSPMETPEVEATAAPDAEMDLDSAFAWLESLAEKQGAQEGTLITAPDERLETPPDWVQQEQELASEASAAETEAEVAAIAQELTEPLQVEEQAAIQEPQAVEQQPQELPAVEESAPVMEEPVLQEPTEAPIPPVKETIPDWLSSIGQDETNEPAQWPGEVDAVSSQTISNEEIPDWLKEPALEEPSAAETNALPLETPTEEEAVPDWLMDLEAGEAEEFTEPYPKEAEIPPVPGDFRSAWEPEVEIGQPVAKGPAGQSPAVGSLSDVQVSLNQGELDRALAGYNHFIQNGTHLDEAIHDLRDALYRYPVDIAIWQTLGDAYARNNQLQEALDAYTKAEELLR